MTILQAGNSAGKRHSSQRFNLPRTKRLALVSFAVKYVQDLNGSSAYAIVDDVSAKRKSSCARMDLIRRKTHAWLQSKESKYFMGTFEPAISMLNAVLRYKFPDVSQVALCLRRYGKSCH